MNETLGRDPFDHERAGLKTRSSGGYEFLHGSFRDERLADGDVLHVELTPRVENYSARLMRPIIIGGASSRQSETADRIIRLLDEQIAAMKPGTLARDVDAIVRRGLIDGGLRPDYPNVTAYTLGLYTRTTRPSDFSRVFLPNADWPLEAGMVFHVYASAEGLAFSETVLVTELGGRHLTRTSRTLIHG